jgi:hypothetical protein
MGERLTTGDKIASQEQHYCGEKHCWRGGHREAILGESRGSFLHESSAMNVPHHDFSPAKYIFDTELAGMLTDPADVTQVKICPQIVAKA